MSWKTAKIRIWADFESLKKIIRYNIEFYVALIKKLTFNYMYDIILNKEVYTMKKKYIKILIIALFTISIIILFVLLTHWEYI